MACTWWRREVRALARNQPLTPEENINTYIKNYILYLMNNKKNLRGFGPLATVPTERPPLVGELVSTFADRECYVVSATDPPVVSLGFLDRSRYYFFQVAPQLSSRGWADPVPDPLLLRKSGRAGNRTPDLWICSQKLWPLDHRGGQWIIIVRIFSCDLLLLIYWLGVYLP
jgi:hypothetical protein